MKKNLLLILTFCLCITSVAQTEDVAADSLTWPQNLRVKVDSVLMTPLLQTSQLGLMIYDLTADSVLYTSGHRQTLRPASTMKLVTAITALDQLPADYQLKTSLYYTGSIRGGTLYGNLCCVGGMDPMFDMADLNYFVNQVRHQGIDTIRGRLLPDLTFKDNDLLGEGWCWDDENPTLTPLLFEGKDGFMERFERELKRDGVVIINTDVPRSRTSKFICARGHTVDDVLVQMMKDSDNLYAESLFYQLAANDGTRPAKAKQSANVVKRIIQKVALRPGDYRIADGSGLSLYNYVSAELETRLLRYVWKRPKLFERLYDSLPIAAVDGTLKKRMLNTYAAGNVHAKTGSVSGISSLAGYCTAANGHELCFSIINQGIMHMADGRDLQDQLCEIMCK